MSTYTPSLGLELITPGSQTGLWGNTTNNSLNLIDQAITGVTPISFAAASGTTVTLTDFNGAQDEARSAVLNITGSATGSNTIVVPNKQKTYLVRNNTGQNVVFQTATPGATYAVEAGYSILIFCDGNNNVFTGIAAPSVGTLSVSGGGTGSTTFGAGGFVKSSGTTNALTASATVDLASEVSGTLPVVRGGTGLTSPTSGAVILGNGTGNLVALAGGTSGNVLTWNGSSWVSSTPASGAVSSVFGRTGAITAQASDYSAYYLGTSGTAANSNQLGGIAAASYVQTSALSTYATLNTTQTFSGAKTFSGGITSTTYTFDSGMSIQRINSSLMNLYVASQVNLALTSTQLYTYGAALKPGGGSWTDSSDERLKENIVPLTGALAKISSLNPVSYEWRYDRANVSNVGFVAQEVAPIFPLAITETEPTDQEKPFIPDGSKVKNIGWQNDMIAYLVGAIKELKAEIDALKAAK